MNPTRKTFGSHRRCFMFCRTRTHTTRLNNRINKKSRFNRLLLQRLEDRTVPTAYLVNALGDAGTGAGTSGDIRYCLTQAGLGGTNTITFDTAGVFAGAVTITLTGGTLNVPSDTTLTGDGAAKLAIDGGGTTRVFDMTGAAGSTSTISAMTIQNGNAGSFGAGIEFGSANATINDCVITGNVGSGEGGAMGAPGLSNTTTITLNNDVVSNNTADQGAGLYMFTGGTVIISSCSFTGNTAISDSGALYLYSGITTISNSTFSNNSAPTGGAMENRFGGDVLTVINSTIANNNSTTGNGAGILVDSGSVSIYNSTIASNTAAGAGGGLSGTINLLSSSIVAYNVDGGTGPDASGTIATANQSLLSNSTGATITTNSGTLLDVDPLLSPLANNGGPTQTMLIGPTSPAKDVGNNTLALATDQRGPGYSRSLGAGPDMGAVEIPAGANPFASASSPNVTVSGGTSQTVTVTYTDAIGSMLINRSTIGNPGENEITVTGPGGFTANPTFVSANSAVNAPTIIATYSFTPPNNVVAGQWDYSDNGAYTILVNANKVYDTDSPTPLAVPAGTIGSFNATMPNPAPTAAGTAPDVTVAGGTTQTVTVTYTDTIGSQLIDRSSIGTGDITVSGPGGFSATPSFVSANSAVDAMMITATYSFTAPDNAVVGTWDGSDNGPYTINMVAGQVYDKDSPVSYPVAAGTIGSFKCTIARVLTVNANTDTGTGVGNAGDFRYCLGMANADVGLADTINFDPTVFNTPQTIALTSGLGLTNNLVTVNGPGASKALVDGGGLYRVLDLNGAALGGGITISGLTLQNGHSGSFGAGIQFGLANTTINDSVITGNVGTGQGGAMGLGPATNATTITLNRDTVSNNSTSAQGAGLYIYTGGTVIISNSSFTGNTASGDSGALYLYSGVTTITGSTFSGNVAGTTGGAIENRGGGDSLTIVNSTIANNNANGGGGGGVRVDAGAVNIYNSTIAGNTATAAGGGISGAVTLLSSTIVANNSDTSAAAPDAGGGTIATSNQSLISNDTGTVITTDNGTIHNMDPMLSPLANNGGPTQTMAIANTSPAKDVGNNTLALANDQRGTGFNRTAGAGTDIGAFEIQPAAAPPTVTNLKIDDGTIQRSMIDSLTVTFSEAVTFTGAIANAFHLHRDSAPPPGPGTEQGGVTGNVNLAAAQVGSVVTLTFLTSGANPINGVGGNGIFSLPDGRYTLTIDHTQVVGIGGNMASDYVLASAPAPAAPTNIFRFFGDVTGDGAVSSADFNGTSPTGVPPSVVGFRQAFGGIDHRFDYNGDGSVAASDFTQFRFRFGGTVP
jgi:hypothetical protein